MFINNYYSLKQQYKYIVYIFFSFKYKSHRVILYKYLVFSIYYFYI